MSDRLLTVEETVSIIHKCEGTVKEARQEVNKAQDAKTAEIVRAELAKQFMSKEECEECQMHTAVRIRREVGEELDIEFIINMLKQSLDSIWQKKGRHICKEQIRKLEALRRSE